MTPGERTALIARHRAGAVADTHEHAAQIRQLRAAWAEGIPALPGPSGSPGTMPARR